MFQPVRFAIRSLGWTEIAEEDLTTEKSSRAVNKAIVDLSTGRNDIMDNVSKWGDVCFSIFNGFLHNICNLFDFFLFSFFFISLWWNGIFLIFLFYNNFCSTKKKNLQGRELIMEIDDNDLTLIDPDTMAVIHSERIHQIRVWGVGRDNGRFVYFEICSF